MGRYPSFLAPGLGTGPGPVLQLPLRRATGLLGLLLTITPLSMCTVWKGVQRSFLCPAINSPNPHSSWRIPTLQIGS